MEWDEEKILRMSKFCSLMFVVLQCYYDFMEIHVLTVLEEMGGFYKLFVSLDRMRNGNMPVSYLNNRSPGDKTFQITGKTDLWVQC